MSTICYTVEADFSNSALADQWLAWLREGHIAEVMAGGAIDGEIIELDSDGRERRFEVRYHFESRAAFELYEKHHAPRLRVDGLKLFPIEQGVTYRRSVATVVACFSK